MLRSTLPWLLLIASGCMDGKKQTPLERTRSLYTQLGGEPALDKVVDDFVASQILPKLITDGKLKDPYRERGLPEVTRDLRRKLVDQIGAATGGPQKVAGPPLKEVYPDLKLNGDEFDSLVNGLVRALPDKTSTDVDRKDLQTRLADLHKQLVGQP